jgi:hypothetical protein
MDIRKRFGTSRELETDGVWVDLGDGSKIKVARIGNSRYNEVFQKLIAPFRRQVRMGNIPNEVADEILVKAMARTVLLDWEGIAEDGKAVPFSVENAYRLMKEYPDFRNVVSEVAQEMETFKEIDTEDATKNSEGSLNGS